MQEERLSHSKSNYDSDAGSADESAQFKRGTFHAPNLIKCLVSLLVIMYRY